MEKLLTTAKACEALNVSRWRLKKWEESAELQPIKTKGGRGSAENRKKKAQLSLVSGGG